MDRGIQFLKKMQPGDGEAGLGGGVAGVEWDGAGEFVSLTQCLFISKCLYCCCVAVFFVFVCASLHVCF